MKIHSRTLLALSLAATASVFNPSRGMAQPTPAATPPGTPESTPAAATPAAATPTAPAEAPADSSAAWKALEERATPPRVPAEWREKQPPPEVVDAWRKGEVERLTKVAEEARSFYSRYPKDANAEKARVMERELLEVAARANGAEAVKRLDELDEVTLKDPALPKEARFQIRAKQVMRGAKNAQDLEVGARELMAEFPGEPQVYQLLLLAATSGTDPERSRAIAEEIAKSNAAPEVKAAAEGIVRKLDAVGKPLDLSFTALDGRKVDLKKMAGKVVLVDFWATWCQPCIVGLPEIIEVYKKYNGKGFEIIGISLDNDKATLEKFLKENDMPWPQYFDGKGFQTEPAVKNGIDAIPALWLVDKKGILREINAREGLAEKVEKLLNEP